MKTAGIVVAFNPYKDDFLRNLRSYSESVDKILVWRNSEMTFRIPEDIQDKIVLCGNCFNEYLAKPYNYALKWCVENGFDFLLTMDQDSAWRDFRIFMDKVESLGKEDVAIFAPNPNGSFPADKEVLPVDYVMTSGSLCNVRIADGLGGFREDYQIYWLDSEFRCCARRNGYRIEVLTDSYLEHHLGHSTRIAFGYTTSNYSPEVYYFIFRNMFWMRREYRDNPCMKSIIHYTIFYFRGILLGERQKGRKFSRIAKGICDGLFKPFDRRKTVSR